MWGDNTVEKGFLLQRKTTAIVGDYFCRGGTLQWGDDKVGVLE